MENLKEQIDNIKSLLIEKKSFDIIDLDIKSKNPFIEHLIIASANSTVHAKSLAKQLITFSKKQAVKIKPNIEGLETGDWIVIDINGIYVHILRPEVREYYKIENFWKDHISKDPEDI